MRSKRKQEEKEILESVQRAIYSLHLDDVHLLIIYELKRQENAMVIALEPVVSD